MDSSRFRRWGIAVRAITVWFALCAAAFLNGALRELVITRLVSEPWAHHASALTAVMLFAAIVFGTRHWLRISGAKQAWTIGLVWLVLTIMMETFVIGRWMSGLSWQSILASYDLQHGSLWPLVLVWVLVLPVVATAVPRVKRH